MAFGGVPSILGGSSGGGTVGPTLSSINSITSSAGSTLTLATLDTNQDVIVSPNNTGKLAVGGSFTIAPSSGTTINVGPSGFLFENVGGFFKWTNNASLGLWFVNNSFAPATDATTLDIGASTLRWRRGYYAPSGISVGGSGSGTTTGEVTTAQQITKPVTAISNAVATGVLTITVPNAAHSATVRVTLNASLGAGGTVGANEASACISYDISITRTAGVNAVGTVSTAFGSAASNVAGATTCTVTAALSAVSGAVGATNTFTVNATISRGAGTSTNHTCLVKAEVINSNASGITLS